MSGADVKSATKAVRAFLEKVVEHLAESGEIDLYEEADSAREQFEEFVEPAALATRLPS